MKNKTIVLSILIAAFTIGSIFMLNFKPKVADAKELMTMSKGERIGYAKSRYVEFEEDPEEKICVMISFDNTKNKNQVKDLLSQGGLEVEKVFHVSKTDKKTYTGAYIDCKEKSVEEILERYELEVKAMIENKVKRVTEQLEIMREEIISISNPDSEKGQEEIRSVESYQKHLSDLKQRQDDFEKNGLKIYGIKVSGKKSKFSEISKDNQYVLEILDMKNSQKVIPILISE